MKYAFIQRHRKVWPISVQCRVLEVSVAGYHEHIVRQASHATNSRQRRHLGIKKLQKYHFRMNSNVPPMQIGGPLQAVFQGYIVATANLDTLVVHGIHQARDGAHPFPAEISGLI